MKFCFILGEEYTVFVPTDHAFQRWHPIDWGFYPFSVPEFTEDIIINHFVPGNWRQETISDGQKVKTLGGREITFGRKGEKCTRFYLSGRIKEYDMQVSSLYYRYLQLELPLIFLFPCQSTLDLQLMKYVQAL